MRFKDDIRNVNEERNLELAQKVRVLMNSQVERKRYESLDENSTFFRSRYRISCIVRKRNSTADFPAPLEVRSRGETYAQANGAARFTAFSGHEIEAELFFSFTDVEDPTSHKVALDIFDRTVCQDSGFFAVVQFEGDLDQVLFFEILKPQDPKTDSHSRDVFDGQPAGLHRSHIGVAPAELNCLPIMLADFQKPAENFPAFASDSHITVDGYGVFKIDGLSKAATRAFDQTSSFRSQIALRGRQN